MAFVVLMARDAQTGIEDETAPMIVSGLEPSFPNPFNPTTTIRFSLAESGHAALRVYDVSGRLVRILIDEVLPRGNHEMRWDGRNERGEGMASGVYFYRIVVPGFANKQKMVLLK